LRGWRFLFVDFMLQLMSLRNQIMCCLPYRVALRRMLWSRKASVYLPSSYSLFVIMIVHLLRIYCCQLLMISNAGSLSYRLQKRNKVRIWHPSYLRKSYGQYQLDLPFVLHMNFCQAVDLIRQICRLLILCF
jgi:hypothetical protein